MNHDGDDPPLSRRRTVGVVASLFVLSTAAGAYEIAPASVIPLVRASLGVTPTAASWLLSVMFLSVVLASVPVGVVLDRVPSTWAVALAGTALFAAGVWGYAAGSAGSFRWLLASRALGGVAFAAIWTAGADVVSQTVTRDHRATAVGLFTASGPAGFAVGQFASPLVAAAVGWPAVFPAYATVALVGVAGFLAAARGRTLDVDAATPDRAAVRDLLADRRVWLLGSLAFLAYALYLSLNTWLPSYLTDRLGVSLAAAGVLAAAFPAVGVVSRTGGGVVSDRVFDGRRRPVAVLAFAVAAPAVLGLAAVTWVPAVVALVAVAGFVLQLTFALLYTHVSELVASDVRATAIATVTSVGTSGGVVGPLAAAALIQHSGYRLVFLAATATALLGLALATRAPEPE